VLASDTAAKRQQTDQEEGVIMSTQQATETVGEYEVPVDPMDDMQCDSCQ
jgi:hypothetical protein